MNQRLTRPDDADGVLHCVTPFPGETLRAKLEREAQLGVVVDRRRITIMIAPDLQQARWIS